MNTDDNQPASPPRSELREIPAPPEPHEAYPEPQLGTTEITALVRGKTFLATDLAGNVTPPGHPNVGFFHDDTRYLSQLQLLVNGHPAVVLSSNTSDAYATRVEMTAKGSIQSDGLDLPVNTLYIRREQVLEESSLHDVLHMQNFHVESVRLTVDLCFDVDFMDIFQVRGILRGKCGRYYEPVHRPNGTIFVYEGLDNRLRSTSIRFNPPPARIHGKTASWDIELGPNAETSIGSTIVPNMMEKRARLNAADFLEKELLSVHGSKDLEGAVEGLEHDLNSWLARCSRFRSDNDIFDNMLQTSARDFYALQIQHSAGRAIAAGIPWFATLFGRDSLIASFETLILNRTLAKGTLKVLAAHQGTCSSDEHDEDPGKILHEFRAGEMTNTGEIAFGRNYGSVDSTPLFVILLSEYILWSGEIEFLREMEPHLNAAIQWLLHYGDLDGDGMIEYCRRSPKGLFNQGWKDSGDAIAHADGEIARPPIALIEVQGYAADAFARASGLYSLLESPEKSEEMAKASRELRKRFQQAFWLPEEHFYAMALDSTRSLPG